jgi:competence ComEA-like helix-hairpin-helix protein
MTSVPSPIRFAGQQSYTLHEEQVALRAELAAPPGFCATLSLQLWATRLDNAAIAIKVAELAVPSYSGDASGLLTVQGDAPLSLPAGQFAWVLSLALVETGESGALERDRIGFSLPTVFELPKLSGGITGEPDAGGLRLTLPGVYNPRPAGSLSGSLAVALWALPHAYEGGAFTGVLLGQQDLGQLAGQAALAEQCVHFPLPLSLAGDWVLTVMLREWTAGGWLTRDYQTLPPVLAAAPAVEPRAALPVKAETEAAPVNVSATAPVAAAPAAAATSVSVNTASMEALAAVKGVGAKLAAAIVAGRPYAVMTDLLRVRGMGEKLLAKLRHVLGL